MTDVSPEVLVLVIAMAEALWGRCTLISQQNEWQGVRAPKGPKHSRLLQWSHKIFHDGTGFKVWWVDDDLLCLAE